MYSAIASGVTEPGLFSMVAQVKTGIKADQMLGHGCGLDLEEPQTYLVANSLDVSARASTVLSVIGAM
jgi:hypothetical protein